MQRERERERDSETEREREREREIERERGEREKSDITTKHVLKNFSQMKKIKRSWNSYKKEKELRE